MAAHAAAESAWAYGQTFQAQKSIKERLDKDGGDIIKGDVWI